MGIPQCEFATVTGPNQPVPHWTGHLLGSAITLQAPTAGEQLAGGGIYTIGWESTPDVCDVKIELSHDGGSGWSTVDTVPNDHRYDWTIPMATSDNCVVRVSDAADANTVNLSGAFTINSCVEALTADTSGDCFVNFVDFNTFAFQWLACGDPCDVNCLP